MKTLELIKKYFKKKDHQVVSEELNEFYDDVATGLRIAKQSPTSQNKVKSTFLFEKKKLKPLIKNIDGVIKKLKDVRFIGSSSIDEEHKALVKLKNVASKVAKLPTQPKIGLGLAATPWPIIASIPASTLSGIASPIDILSIPI